MPKPYYPSLNGLRAVSVLMVICCHLFLKYPALGAIDRIQWLSPFRSFISDGNMGVSMFFIISGFLITSLMIGEEQEHYPISLKKFYMRRILRIFPAYYFVLLVYFVLQTLGYIHLSTFSWITSLTYTKYLNWRSDWYTAHFWSLSIEEQFYLFWPLIFLLGKKTRKIFALSMIVIVPLIKIWVYLYPVDRIDDLTIFERIDGVSLGCLCAIYRTEIIKVLSKHWGLFFALALGLLVIFHSNFVIDRYELWIGEWFGILHAFYGTMVNMLIAIIMIYSVFGPQKWWFKVMNSKPAHLIGILSYSLYLWQQVFIADAPYYLNRFPLNILCILMAALGSYYFIERPFLKIKHLFK